MKWGFKIALPVLSAILALPVQADDLTLRVEQDLVRLGYDSGVADGEETLDTSISVAKYQAEHGFEITGDITEDLARTLSETAAVGQPPARAALQPATGRAENVSERGLRAAREACLKDKMLIARATETDEGLSEDAKDKLIDQAARMAMQASNLGMLQQVYDVYMQWDSDAEPEAPTQSETAAIANTLGVSEDDVAACQRPAGQGS